MIIAEDIKQRLNPERVTLLSRITPGYTSGQTRRSAPYGAVVGGVGDGCPQHPDEKRVP